MAADPSIVALQTAINRYNTVGVPLVGVDGILGPKTADALIKSLGFIANQIAAARDTAAGLVARLVTDQGAYNYAQIMQSAPGLAIYLGDRADEATLPRPSTGGALVAASKPLIQTTKSASAPDIVLQLKKPSMAASLADIINRMPKAVAYGGGAVLALGALAAVIYTSKKRRAPAVSGRWY